MILNENTPIPFINYDDLANIVAVEGLADVELNMEQLVSDSMTRIQNKFEKKAGRPMMSSDWEEYVKVKSYIVNNASFHEKHLYIDENMFWANEYTYNLFTYISKLKSTDTIKLYFVSDYCEPWYIRRMAPLMNALKLTNANTIAMITNRILMTGTIVALGCKSYQITDLGALTFQKSNFNMFGNIKINDEVLDSLYTSYLTRGIITPEEFEAMSSNSSKVLTLYSDDLRQRPLI